ALVSLGMSRDDAYRLVQELAARAVGESTQFRELLVVDKRIDLTSKQLDEIFDLKKSVKHTNRVFEALASKQL
ncbi:MAG: adenylosuccinate lyase, partial [Actinobacteria bacterium]|nr:adenylosuccinate lyase [Actinomycetota bacterium]